MPAAIVDGNHNRGGIASYLGRKSTDLAHLLAVLQDVGMITHEQDAFRRNRSAYRIAEPLLAFYHAVMRAAWGELERPGRAANVWRRLQPTFRSKVVGPHFERICREWTPWYSDSGTLGGIPSTVAGGTVPDPADRTAHEIDVVAFGQDETGRKQLLAIGECKWNDVMGLGHLRRLDQVRDLLRAREGVNAERTRLLLFSGTGFSDDRRAVARQDPTVQPIDMTRLHTGV
ncbi:hypothetical protein ABZT47_10110 [Sphaerisporangium sp. NPDC005289]|uniref:hypothetical protein n=1 Tax=Sphaerisporangium sp. NPDC005289 TaxID=3155247 RepID=UPI0033BD3A16